MTWSFEILLSSRVSSWPFATWGEQMFQNTQKNRKKTMFFKFETCVFFISQGLFLAIIFIRDKHLTIWEIDGSLCPRTRVDVGISEPVVFSSFRVFEGSVRNKSVTCQNYEKIKNNFVAEVTKSPRSTWSMEYIINYYIFKIHIQHSNLTAPCVKQIEVKMVFVINLFEWQMKPFKSTDCSKF